MSRLLALAASLVLVLPTFAADKPIVIGMSLDTLKEERWQRDRDNFTKAAGDLGAEVIVQSANSDDIRQVRDIESLITRGVDVLVIAAHNAEALGRAVKSANDAGIPILCYDRLILNADVDAYISFDNVNVGEVQAQYAADRFPKDRPARIVRIYGSPADYNAKLFKEGQDKVLQPLIDAGKVEVVAEDWALDWRPENAKKIMNAAISRGGTEIDAVIASNDGTAGGAIQALVEEGVAGKILVTGQDADLAACQRILRGTQAMTVYKPLGRVAEEAAALAVALARKEPVPTETTIDNQRKQVPAVFVPVIAVDKENLAATVVADGFHPAESLQ